MAALALVVLAVAAVLASAQTEKLYVAELVPAPVGYSFTFQEPFPEWISGYRNSLGNYRPYKARIGETGVLLIVGESFNVEKLISPAETGTLRIIEVVSITALYGLNLPGDRDLVVYGSGVLYFSYHEVFVDMEPLAGTERRALVVRTNRVDFREAERYAVALAVTGPHSINVVTRDGLSLSVSFPDLLGVDDACITWFKDVPVWKGGVLLSPTCTRNIRVIKQYTYEGRPYAVVFEANTRYGVVRRVIMAEPTARALGEAGIVIPISVTPGVHVVRFTVDNVVLYRAPSPDSILLRGRVIDVSNATQAVLDRDGSLRPVCIIPAGAEIVYALLWRSRPLVGAVNPGPGEVIVYRVGSDNYLCHGDLSWLDSRRLPDVTGPTFRELPHPVYFRSTPGERFLLMLSNGVVYSAESAEIPFDSYNANEVFVYAAGTLYSPSVTPRSLLTSPFVVIGLLVVVVLAGAIVMSMRGVEREEVIRLVLDLPEPKRLTLATREELAGVVRKHVDMFGVCPDLVDMVLYHKVLPPLPDRVDSPLEDVILCPYETNPETEKVLRELAELFHTGLWAVRRTSRSGGYIYTLVGDTMLYLYWYKRERGEKPEETVVRAVESAYRTRFNVPYHTLPLGLAIVAEEEAALRIEREVEYMKALSVGSSEARAYNIKSYVTSRDVKSDVELESLQEFVNKNVPAVLVVSRRSFGSLLEYVAERLASYSELYYRRLRRGEREEHETA